MPDPTSTRQIPALPRATSRRAGGLSRRRMLGGAMASAGLTAMGHGLKGAWSAAARQATPGAATLGAGEIGGEFVEPPLLRSQAGRLDVALKARLGPATVGGRAVTTYTYNGLSTGPTLRLRPGETLGVSLSNEMEEAATNLHTHGLHVSPSGASDNVFVHLMPGESIAYEYAIPPDGLSGLTIPGFYWYHPHLHGYTSDQVSGGMSGALIIAGGLDDLPALQGLPERLLVLQATQFDADGMLISFPKMDEIAILVNGQAQPTLTIGPGETQRWRILNASSFTFMNLTLDGHRFHQIASDANPLREVWNREVILLAPGERIEVLIQGGEPGDYAFRSLPWGEASEFQAQPEIAIATLTSAGPPVAPAPLPETLIPFEDLREATIDRRRELTFSETFDPFRLWIDNHAFDPNRVDQRIMLGATEEWRIRNTSPDWHPFHIHVNDFQVMAVNGEPVTARSWEDTTPIPAFGEIVIRSRFLDFPGKFVYHCHILDHEDQGMMGVVEVVDGSATPIA